MLLHITRSLLRQPTCRWRKTCNKKSRDWITSWKILFYERPVNINVNFSRKFSDTDAKTDVSRYDCVTSSSIMHTLKSLFTQFFGRCDLKRECISYSFNAEKVPRISTTTEIDWLSRGWGWKKRANATLPGYRCIRFEREIHNQNDLSRSGFSVVAW